MTVNIVPVSDLRRDTARLIQEADDSDEPIYITQHGRPKAILLSYQAYEQLLARLEDLADLAALREGAAESVRPFAEFLQELGEE